MTLSRDGNLTTRGSASVGGNLTAPSATINGNLTVTGSIAMNGKSMSYNELDEWIVVSSRTEQFINGQYTSPPLLFRFTKIGRVVTLTIPEFWNNSGTNLSNAWFAADVNLPEMYRPALTTRGSAPVLTGGSQGAGVWTCETYGRFTINSAAANGYFNGTAQNGWFSFTATWTTW